MIPNVVHFIYFNGPGSREFGFVNYMAIRTAYEVQKPDALYLYYNTEPVGNPHWDRMKQYAILVQIDPPKEFMGVDLPYVQYQADVVRLQKLFIHGGIYLDTDVLMLKPLTPLMNRRCVMGAEGYVDHVPDLHTTDVSKVGSISNAVIMAERFSAFIRDWLTALPDGLKTGVWAYHAVTLPLEMYKADTSVFDLQEAEAFVPFDFRNTYIFGNNYDDLNRLDDSYTVHLWETIWKDELRQIDDKYLRTKENLFTYLFGKYAEARVN
ncbi:Glycosyltransferase, DXD sugar-binding motif [uncultured Caudovirales phage]|uniref:Glycosyltransferase, DXD sugar-binding motif n=1 Tax=uncultured Caudovirales phage TaxID=2100421 RepID=A0A6J5N7H6_9CAUD|nr:Glycosyltransferase, DXD sugar-binding motif [uncultured Caudovirales phage]CAB4168773.1 Glycosyltransferase, DXD sugar-binding motif [uncultured Caudovirales phage]CAB4181438.1 Glycosyltransferase, DXD sugar-binding motif [uncultured Caudovirales phage]CAB4195710.1 Glycosyltransferase, DXD sugar-binding motif [uncultured Caudovirales phage]CAB4210403.1 Glycosyltransferase, DXD sugar-binding motif [uncultured Caudovirales phage]